MTDPTPESVEDALMNRLVALVDAWRANGTEPSAMALASIAGIVRENMPPACACDGGLFGAGPGDHAIGCPARPPEAPGERRPVAGWEFDAYENRWKNYVGGYVLVVWLRVCKDDAGNPTHGWMVARVADEDDDVESSRDIDSFDLAAAQLAAEDAAADLLLAGLRALGRVT